jgi:hypothetical protein
MVNLLNDPKTPNHAGRPEYQRHVAIEWEGGVIWLNTYDFVDGYETESPHYCIDVRQFNSAGRVKGQGVFTMARGFRGSIASIVGESTVGAHDWNGGYLVAILTDPDGQEKFTDVEKED